MAQKQQPYDELEAFKQFENKQFIQQEEKINKAEKPNKIVAASRLFFGFCPNCNSDAPKKDNCKICNNGQYKKRKDLKERFREYDLLHLSDKDKQSVINCIDWIRRINNLDQ